MPKRSLIWGEYLDNRRTRMRQNRPIASPSPCKRNLGIKAMRRNSPGAGGTGLRFQQRKQGGTTQPRGGRSVSRGCLCGIFREGLEAACHEGSGGDAHSSTNTTGRTRDHLRNNGRETCGTVAPWVNISRRGRTSPYQRFFRTSRVGTQPTSYIHPDPPMP